MDYLKQHIAKAVRPIGPIQKAAMKCWWTGYCEGKGIDNKTYLKGIELIDQQ